MTIGPEEVLRLARLARVRMDGEEADRLTRELNAILGHMEELQRVPVEGADEGAPAAAGTAPRPDRPGADPLHLPLEELVPALEAGLITVPRLEALDAGADRDG